MSQPTTHDVIVALEAPFSPSEIKQRPGNGGAMLDYIDWPTAIHRLNDAAGPDNWDYRVGKLEHVPQGPSTGYFICDASITIRFPDGTSSVRSGFGGAVYGQGGRGMAPDDAAKAAGSDALKKSAQLFGVALYLAEKEGSSFGGGNGYQNNGSGQSNGYANQRPSAPSTQQQVFTQGQGQQGSFEGAALYCEECSEPLTETKFKDGSIWTPDQLAAFGRRKHGRVLNMDCYRKANEAKRRAEQDQFQQAPF